MCDFREFFILRQLLATVTTGENHLDQQNMMMFTSDGASVMLGKNNGVAAILRREMHHLCEQHCVADREDIY